MIVSIASGKGGTGKTTVAVNLALSLGDVRLLDCDVEEPNCHIFLKPTVEKTEPVEVKVPEINEKICDYCGKCAEFCRYNALAVTDGVIINFQQLCHSCGGCVLICPKKAITETPRTIGEIKHCRKDRIEFSYGILKVGEAMVTPVIKKLKKCIKADGDVIIDAPPGTSCAVVESIRDSDYCLLVAEPTPFGLNDLKLAVEMLTKLNIPYGVILNKDGLGDIRVLEYCETEDIPIHLKIPHSHRIAELYSNGVSFTEYMRDYKTIFRGVFNEIREII